MAFTPEEVRRRGCTNYSCAPGHPCQECFRVHAVKISTRSLEDELTLLKEKNAKLESNLKFMRESSSAIIAHALRNRDAYIGHLKWPLLQLVPLLDEFMMQTKVTTIGSIETKIVDCWAMIRHSLKLDPTLEEQEAMAKAVDDYKLKHLTSEADEVDL